MVQDSEQGLKQGVDEMEEGLRQGLAELVKDLEIRLSQSVENVENRLDQAIVEFKNQKGVNLDVEQIKDRLDKQIEVLRQNQEGRLKLSIDTCHEELAESIERNQQTVLGQFESIQHMIENFDNQVDQINDKVGSIEHQSQLQIQ